MVIAFIYALLSIFSAPPFHSNGADLSTGAVIQQEISPNEFQGSDSQRIQQAVRKAHESGHIVRIPAHNGRGSSKWLIDEAILLPSNVTVVLDNCTLQLSDASRDNMFRSDNVGAGITDPQWNRNIHLIGVGRVLLRGAENPRATGITGCRKSAGNRRRCTKTNPRPGRGTTEGHLAGKLRKRCRQTR